MINKVVTELRIFNQNIKKNKISYIKTYFSFIFSFLRYGSSPRDYFRYYFHKKNCKEKSKYMTYRRSQKVIKKYNDKKSIYQFENKYLFNQNFSEFINREYIYTKNSTEASLKEFVYKHGEVIVKPLNEGQGRGIFKLKKDNFNNHIENLISNEYLLEEVIIPQKEIYEINPYSLSTIRVLTFTNNNKVYVLGSVFKSSSTTHITDHLNLGGIAAPIDNEGIIYKTALDKDFNEYIYHPLTKIKLLGFKIENYNLVIDMVKKSSLIASQKGVNYVGWDIAITDKGFEIIEGNHDPGHSSIQLITREGYYSQFKEITMKNRGCR